MLLDFPWVVKESGAVSSTSLIGAVLLSPAVNYWWPGFPRNLSKQAYESQLPQDQWALRVSHYIPWLTYWWNTQKLFPALSYTAYEPSLLNPQDIEVMAKYLSAREKYQDQVNQQGDFESLHRDLIVGLGKWEFDPMDLENPFPNNEGSVHLWQGDEDGLVPVTLQRHFYILKSLICNDCIVASYPSLFLAYSTALGLILL
nr:Abhydrolase_6 domain-containing protein [Ipomoea batatas]